MSTSLTVAMRPPGAASETYLNGLIVETLAAFDINQAFWSILPPEDPTDPIRPLGPAGTEVLNLPTSVLRYDAVVKMAARMRDLQPDIVHARSYRVHTLVVRAAMKAGVPNIVVSFHDLRLAWHRVQICKYLREHIDSVIVLNRFMEQLYCQRIGYSDQQLVVWPNPVDLQEYRPRDPNDGIRDELGLSAKDIVVGCVGRLVSVKGLPYLLQAIHLARAQNPRIRLVVVGSGHYRERLQDQASELNIHQHCIFTGKRTDIPRLLSVFDIFALPSILEADPIALKEAMAAGKACVATRCGGPTVILEDERTGLLVPKENARALSEAIVLLARDDDLRKRLGINARAVAEKEYDIQTHRRRVQELYSRYLPEVPRP